jgi:cell wall-associated NlpC family hydrolase
LGVVIMSGKTQISTATAWQFLIFHGFDEKAPGFGAPPRTEASESHSTFGVLETRALLISAIFFLPFMAGARVASVVLPNDTIVADSLRPVSLPERVLNLAQTYLGTPYRYGSNATDRFDCSGFVRHCYGSCEINLPHGSGSQAQLCDVIDISEVQPGDLLFFKGRNVNSSLIGHVAMVYDVVDGKIKMIHATTHRGVIIETYNDSPYYTPRFVKAGRLKPCIIEGLIGPCDH